MRTRIAISLALLFMLVQPAFAQTKNQGLADVGTGVAIALPVTAAAISYFKDDWTGIEQLALVGGATVGTAFILKQIVHEQRPDHTDFQSFPSYTAAVAFAPAQYLWDRYGWQYGVPAYAAAAFAGYTTVASDEHHWWDVAASAGIAWGYSFLFTSRWHAPYNLESSVYVTPRSAVVALNYRW